MEDKLIDILKKYSEREASDKLNSLGMTDNEERAIAAHEKRIEELQVMILEVE